MTKVAIKHIRGMYMGKKILLKKSDDDVDNNIAVLPMETNNARTKVKKKTNYKLNDKFC